MQKSYQYVDSESLASEWRMPFGVVAVVVIIIAVPFGVVAVIVIIIAVYLVQCSASLETLRNLPCFSPSEIE